MDGLSASDVAMLNNDGGMGGMNGCPCESIPDTVSIVLVDGPGDVVSTLTDVVKL